jgi:DNA-binding MarR family transcriptional regulator
VSDELRLTAEQRAVWTGMVQITERLIARVDEAFRSKFNITVAEAELIFLLSLDPAPQRVLELADRVLISQSSVSRALARLEDMELAVRARARDDARATEVRLSERGRLVARQLRAIEEAVVHEHLFANLKQEQTAQVLRALRDVSWVDTDISEAVRQPGPVRKRRQTGRSRGDDRH